jgi:hypothetical protein
MEFVKPSKYVNINVSAGKPRDDALPFNFLELTLFA